MSAVCWCGSLEVSSYSPEYRRCMACGTLVTLGMPQHNIARVGDDSKDFYGRDYWFGHQSRDLGHPDIVQRARTDLPERCAHWMRALLRHKLPPGKALEVGAAHGGFVALMRQAGFDAAGLELSPSIVTLARSTFGVPMWQGLVEDCEIPPGSLDVIALFDVLEHLQQPLQTMRHCLELLGPEGLLMIQTPRVPPEVSYEDLTRREDPFLAQFKKEEHLFLFTEDGVRELFRRLEAPELDFLPAIFSHYDMFLAVSRRPLVTHSDAEIAAALRSSEQRVVLALLDLYQQYQDAARHLSFAARDAEERLQLIRTLEAQLRESEADRAERLRVIHALDAQVRALENDGTKNRVAE